MSEGHDHEHVNGSNGASEPQIFLPPPEVLLDQYRNELGRLTNENFELRSAATFQSGVISQLQIELAKRMEADADEPATSDI